VTTEEGAASDEVLASSARQGDRAAFEALVRRHKASLYGLVRRYVGQADDAYDLVQEAFIVAWETLHRYDPGRPFLPWLRTIALNKCRDFSRRQKFRRWLLRAYGAEIPLLAESMGQHEDEAQIAESERLRRLDRAIADLPANYKEPLLLTTVGGLSQQEVAATLHTTPKAIEMRLRRARKKLAHALGESESEG
jgi:RNA polymerase sigma-70 factor (ECF subfamily)